MDNKGQGDVHCPADAYRGFYVLSINIQNMKRDPWEAVTLMEKLSVRQYNCTGCLVFRAGIHLDKAIWNCQLEI